MEKALNRMLGTLTADAGVAKRDGLLALLLLALYSVFLCVAPAFVPRGGMYVYKQMGLQSVWIFMVLLITKRRGQSLQSVGLRIQGAPFVLLGCIICVSVVYAAVHADISYVTGWAFYLVAVSGLEELLFRGYAYPRIYKLTGSHTYTLLLLGAVFGALHGVAPVIWDGAPLYSVLNHIGGGILINLLFALVYAQTGSLWNAIILHAALDYTAVPWVSALAAGCVVILLFAKYMRCKNAADMTHVVKNERRKPIMTFWDACSPVYDYAQKRNTNYDKWNACVAENVAANSAVLELAGGTGEISIRVSHKAREVVCTDLSANMLKRAMKKARSIHNISFEIANIYDLHYSDASFDVVIASQVLHLLDNPQKAADEIKRVARERIILPVCLVKNVKGFARFQIGLWKMFGFKPKHDFDKESYISFLEGCGFTIEEAVVIEGSMPMIVVVCNNH